jgi:hypothetical protein
MVRCSGGRKCFEIFLLSAEPVRYYLEPVRIDQDPRPREDPICWLDNSTLLRRHHHHHYNVDIMKHMATNTDKPPRLYPQHT